MLEFTPVSIAHGSTILQQNTQPKMIEMNKDKDEQMDVAADTMEQLFANPFTVFDSPVTALLALNIILTFLIFIRLK